jgi:hypothetical protein
MRQSSMLRSSNIGAVEGARVIRSKQDVLDTLRRAGVFDLVEGREDELPDPVDFDRDEPLLAQLGITRGMLIDLMGGSP